AVENRELEGAAGDARRLERGDRGVAAVDDSRLGAPRAEKRPQEPAVRRMVVHGQHAQLAERAMPGARRCGHRLSRTLELRREMEGAAQAHRALHPDASPHQLGELATDRKTE